MYLKRIRASLGWDIIDDNARLNIDNWKFHLGRIGFDVSDIEKIVDTYLEIGTVIDATDIETVRWFCDGHLSFFFLWCAFAKCAYMVPEQVNDKRKVAQSILKYGDATRFQLMRKRMGKIFSNQFMRISKRALYFAKCYRKK